MDERSIDLIAKTAQVRIRFRGEGIYRFNDNMFLDDINTDLAFLGMVLKAPTEEILVMYGNYVCPLGKC